MSETRDSIADVWGPRAPFRGEGRWPPRVDQHLAARPDEWVRSCCVLCSNGCALDVGVMDGRIVGVRGLKTDRVNRGRLGPKGLHGWQANNSPDRGSPGRSSATAAISARRPGTRRWAWSWTGVRR